MNRITEFVNRAAKAVLGGLGAGVAAAQTYAQASPLVDLTDWEPWASGVGTAAFTGFIVYMTTNHLGGGKPPPADQTTVSGYRHPDDPGS